MSFLHICTGLVEGTLWGLVLLAWKTVLTRLKSSKSNEEGTRWQLYYTSLHLLATFVVVGVYAIQVVWSGFYTSPSHSIHSPGQWYVGSLVVNAWVVAIGGPTIAFLSKSWQWQREWWGHWMPLVLAKALQWRQRTPITFWHLSLVTFLVLSYAICSYLAYRLWTVNLYGLFGTYPPRFLASLLVIVLGCGVGLAWCTSPF